MRITARRLVPALALLALGWGRAPAADAPGAAYVLDPAKSSLEFSFTQAGARNNGRFTRFPVSFVFSPEAASGRLEVTIEVGSLDTGDKDRDDTLRGADLFAVAKYPKAQFLATQFTRTAAGYEAIGKLTIRDVTRDARVPFTFRTANEGGANVAYMAGKTGLKRLDFGVGQGDWKDTGQVGNEVGVSFNLRLVPATH
ncbi:MAG: YceI family protein [Proteobacteria bacterium]|nr:YceI family protein [Pseudomonadota bacterium]